MGHSLQAYLEKLSTPELEAALRYCLQQAPQQDHTHNIIEILQVLKKRKNSSKTEKN